MTDQIMKVVVVVICAAIGLAAAAYIVAAVFDWYQDRRFRRRVERLMKEEAKRQRGQKKRAGT